MRWSSRLTTEAFAPAGTSAALGGNLRGERFGQEHRRAQIDRVVTVEAGAIERSDPVRLEYARVVDEQGQRADRRHGSRHETEHRAVICEIAADHRRGSAGGGDLGAQVPRRRHRTVGMDRDRIAGAGQRQHDGAADPLGASGDEGGRRGQTGIEWVWDAIAHGFARVARRRQGSAAHGAGWRSGLCPCRQIIEAAEPSIRLLILNNGQQCRVDNRLT